MIGLRVHQKLWLTKHKKITGKSSSRLLRELLDKEINRQDRAFKKKVK